MRDNKISKKKQKAINEHLKAEINIGDPIKVYKAALRQYGERTIKENEICKIIKINDELIHVKWDYKEYIIDIDDIIQKETWHIGANPFFEKFVGVRSVNYALDSILHTCAITSKDREYEINGTFIDELNWNPFVYTGKGKEFYQRNFVWTTEQNQLLIESLYKDISCGSILIRKRSWKELESMQKAGENDLAFKDIVDGKQRLNAIRAFLNDEFADKYGNFHSDLSDYAQHKLLNNQLLGYAEMSENSTDKEVLYQFLKMNFTGVPQSVEHLDFVQKIQSHIK